MSVSPRRRVTLRCLTDDLTVDWTNASDYANVCELRRVADLVAVGREKESALARLLRNTPKTNLLDHPLVRHFEAQFMDDGSEIRRETISSVSDRVWYKQRTNRWRGAATYDDAKVAWLCAGGLRREGDVDDFYSAFAKTCAGGSEARMPDQADHALARVEGTESLLSAWRLQVAVSTLALVFNALSTGAAGPLAIRHPKESGSVVATLAAEVNSISDDGEELTELILVIEPGQRQHKAFADVMLNAALAALDPEAASWTIGSTLGGTTYAALITTEMREQAGRVGSGATLTDADVQDLVVGTKAHYARRAGLTEATVTGEPVEAMCGYWFVPMHDHEARELCEQCRARNSELA